MDSLKMMQLYCHSGDTQYQPSVWFPTTFIIPETSGACLTGTAVDSQDASMRDLWLIALGDKCRQNTPRPKRIVSA